MPGSANAQTLADQPQDQREAVRKILGLGGDWELGAKTVLIGFIGDKFTNDKYVLLAPLVDLKHLAVIDSPSEDRAFVHCEKLENIESLYFNNCKFTGVGLRHLSRCKKLKTVNIEGAPISDEGLAALTQFEAVEILWVSHEKSPSKVTAVGVRKLKSLKKLKQLSLEVADLPDRLQDEMKTALPGCEISLSKSHADR